MVDKKYTSLKEVLNDYSDDMRMLYIASNNAEGNDSVLIGFADLLYTVLVLPV